MSNKSGTSSQVITLPSGGGALQGIGETFSPDLFTGTGNFTVPLTLPPGRNGFQPKLALVYSTGNGNGPLGLGWALDVPGVSRKTSKGVPRYLPKQDTFILSGAEDLVPISEPSPDLTRFQPRTEGLFARIERVQSGEDDFWRVRSKDGLVSLYGSASIEAGDPAIVADPTIRNKIFCWKLSQTTDPFGNRIKYQYLRDSGSEGPHVWDQVYLQKVQYIDYEKDGAIHFLVSVTFIYEERPDPFSDYRAGFEIRTRLRCKRIEIRTHADNDRLVRTYELVYLDERVSAGKIPSASLPLNGTSLFSQVRVTGHDGNLSEKLPPLEFGYTRFAPEQKRFQPIKAVNNALPPRSLADGDFEMVSLFANGLPDIVQMNGSVQFWRNLGNGVFDMPRTMNEVPAGVHLRDPGVQFADMNGNGRADLLVLNQKGYFPLSFQGRWTQGFVQYDKAPNVSLDDPNFRLVDLDGDGVTDALRAGESFELYFNDPLKGWDKPPELRSRQPLEVFPNLNFSDPRVKLADLTGDDLQDFVFVEQGRIDYWPYLGHGQWGKRVTMKNSPVFQDSIPLPGGFDAKRVMLGDLDGDGLDDILYVEANKLTFWINQGGEGWSDPLTINNTPLLTNIDAVRLADMLGTGMFGVLWTFDQVAGMGSNFQFLDLTAGLKPYLLDEMNNHMGAITRVQYAPSTKFYLADLEKPQTGWKMPLPFPVQVIERVEVIDEISKGKLTTEYHYHHGYWDGSEREFRGFGRVEQLDTEIFEEFNSPGLHGTTPFESVPAHSFSPSLLTKTWFHPGPIGDEFSVRSEPDFRPEHWPGDLSALPRPTNTLQLLQSLPASQRGDAIRSLRGRALRTELYALDGSERENRPYTVTESQYGIREESHPVAGEVQRRRIFFPHSVAQRTTQWERGDEPMTQFSFTDDYDEYGQPRREVSLAVPRHRDYRVPAPPGSPYLGTVTERQFAQRDDTELYIVDRVAASMSFESLNDGSLTVLDLFRQIQAGTASLKMLDQVFNYYDGEAFVGLQLAELGEFGLLVRKESLVMSEELLHEAYNDPADANAPGIPPYLRLGNTRDWPGEYPREFQDSTPKLAGYTFADGSDHRAKGYFAQFTRIAFDFQVPGSRRCGLPVTTRDPLNNETTIVYDTPYHLLPVQVTDAVGLTIRAEYNYRILQPEMVSDANGNRRAVSFSPLGMVTRTAVMGKEGEKVGDTLQVPGTYFEYDFFAFVNRQQPILVRSIVREHHVTETDVSLPARDATIECVKYHDGFGRLLQTRAQAEDVLFGDLNFGGIALSADQSISTGDAVGRQRAAEDLPNVVVSGWQVYDNKGRVVERYEPFFAVGWEYGIPADAQIGQKTTKFYDPRGQVIRTLNPDGSEQRMISGIPLDLTNPEHFAPTPWEAYTYDANDLAPLCKSPDNISLANAAPASHHFTASSITIDALGRTILAIGRNRDVSVNGDDSLPATDEIRTQTMYDIRGNVISVTDALGRRAFRYIYDLANRPWRIESIDAGVRHMVLNVMGNEIERRDSKGAISLQTYDLLHRQIRLWARDEADGVMTLRQRIEYGDAGMVDQPAEDRAAMRASNLLGQFHRHHHEAGLTTVSAVDFKGNVLDKSNRIIGDAPILAVFEQAPDNRWNVTPFQTDWEPRPNQLLADRERELLDNSAYQTSATYDALNRIKRMQFPQDAERKRRELRPKYNRAGGLEQVQLDNTLYVERIVYDAKGQRSLIAYGNGVMTRYVYDPQTFRLKRLRSERYTKQDALTYHVSGEPIQDFGYVYDLVGNILRIFDRTPRSGILNNPDALTTNDPVLRQLLASGDALHRRFTYDAIYRLLSASGRECDSPPSGPAWEDQPRCTDFTRTRAYTEQYHYDKMGNMLGMKHHNQTGGFTRVFTIESPSNRLQRVQISTDRYDYAFDPNGNMVSETTSRHFEWNHADQMKAFCTQTEGAEPAVYAHYLYDATGQRVKKLVRKQGGHVEITHYIEGVFEHHRWISQLETNENNHIHVMDDQQCVALVRLGPAHPRDHGPAVQFYLSDHLGSSNAVIDSGGAWINREEFTPYGETSFGSFARKRYRFTGKERDEETGFAYHRTRYYAMWIGRWISPDTVGLMGGLCLYKYSSSNPMVNVDQNGTDDKSVVDSSMDEEYVPSVGAPDRKPLPETSPEVLGRKDLDDIFQKNSILRERVESVAKELDLDPGLLAASLLAEEGPSAWSGTSGKVSSEVLGMDDWFDAGLSHRLKRIINAHPDLKFRYEDVKATGEKWDTSTEKAGGGEKPRGELDATKAVAAFGVYMKMQEEMLRDKLSKEQTLSTLPVRSLDDLSPEKRFTVLRVTLNAGIKYGRDLFLQLAKGGDIPRTGKTTRDAKNAYRTAVLHMARAIHLDQAVFGRPSHEYRPMETGKLSNAGAALLFDAPAVKALPHQITPFYY